MQIIFTATLGRNGSQNLIDLFNRFGIDCIGEHEPPDLPLRRLGYREFFRKRGWFGPGSQVAMIGRDFQRKYVAPDTMVGRGEALRWVDAGDEEKLRELSARRVARIRRFARKGYRHYLEAGPYFLRTYGHQTYELLPDLRLIKLTRDPLRNAKSFVNREKDIFKNALPPDRPSNILRLEDWQGLSKFQLYLHQWFETELRFLDFLDRHEVSKVFVLSTPELSDPERMHEMFSFFGIEHKPLEGLAATNTSGEHGKQSTHIGERELAEFEEFVGLMPPRLRERLAFLQDYDPAVGLRARATVD
jgi:hypothetical protein